ncbi:MAG: PIN domain-containing protein [Paludibacteraceae bacterium]|nr:PIN domain-containing protein [Paludibacteraceae bacterium]
MNDFEATRKIYIDTNVLINYCTGQDKDVQCLNYIFKKRRKESLFTSALAIVQTITNLQTAKKTRKAFSKEKTVEILNKVLSKVTVLNLTFEDIANGFVLPNEDIEDSVHYCISQKRKCDTILTNNVSDFSEFKNIEKLNPRASLSIIKSHIS